MGDQSEQCMRIVCDKPSSDYLVCTQQQRLRDCKAEGLRGLQIDHQAELGGLLDRKISRFGTLKDSIDERSNALLQLAGCRAIGHETSLFGEKGPFVHRRDTSLRRQFD